jgi:hypothetical protein
MNTAISKGLRTHRWVKIDQKLRDELNHCFFLETWDDPLPWRDERHIRISLATDASGSGWGASVFLQETVTTVLARNKLKKTAVHRGLTAV